MRNKHSVAHTHTHTHAVMCGGGVGVDTDVRPDKTTRTGLPLTHRPPTTAVPTFGCRASVVVIYILGVGGGNRTREWGYGENMWNRDLDYGATGVLRVSIVPRSQRPTPPPHTTRTRFYTAAATDIVALMASDAAAATLANPESIIDGGL